MGLSVSPLPRGGAGPFQQGRGENWRVCIPAPRGPGGATLGKLLTLSEPQFCHWKHLPPWAAVRTP